MFYGLDLDPDLLWVQKRLDPEPVSANAWLQIEIQ
jgi:hypothetical protein